jgi:hypothetical protein
MHQTRATLLRRLATHSFISHDIGRDGALLLGLGPTHLPLKPGQGCTPFTAMSPTCTCGRAPSPGPTSAYLGFPHAVGRG